ncbi:3'-5' exonuclease [Streptomyces sp. NPDC014983]|uniref:3'-5' exonuclease n=1 Tax=Streptomyces sp. NPDC014983 TaxID=3364933 RepID=UPI0036F569C1
MQVSTRAAVHSEVLDQHRDRGELALRADSGAQTSCDGSGTDRAEARVPRPAVARRGEDELGPEQSARRLRIRRRELGYLVEAGLLTPTSCTPSGGPRFAVTALDAVSTRPLDWERARAADKRLPSPWRELAGPEAERAALVATACERLRADGVNAWAQHSRVADRWTLDWEPGRFGGPEPDDVTRLLPPRLLRAVAGRQLVLLGPVGQTLHWAHRMLQPGKACVLDVETTGLGPGDRVVEIAVVDAHDGAVLIDTLVHPGAGVRISREARAVHGITDAMVAEAEPWERVLPRVLATTEGRTVLAYNSPFDKRMTVGHARAVGADPGRLALEASWECLMRRRSRWLRTTSRRRLGGRHRARGDALAALEVLRQLRTRPPHTGAA